MWKACHSSIGPAQSSQRGVLVPARPLANHDARTDSRTYTHACIHDMGAHDALTYPRTYTHACIHGCVPSDVSVHVVHTYTVQNARTWAKQVKERTVVARANNHMHEACFCWVDLPSAQARNHAP
jgi:hypothetical protein